jgi:hypothetical protein
MSNRIRNLVSGAFLCASVLFLPTLLHAAGWDWKNPLPSGNNLNAVATLSASEAFAVGDAGTILRYDGERWQPMFSNTNANLYDVWAATATDVFVAGYDVLNDIGIILHYDGERWQRQVIGSEISMGRVWGKSATDVFSAGVTNAGISIIFHYDGTSWTESYVAPAGVELTSIWGLPSGEVFATGQVGAFQGYVFEYDGDRWTEMSFLSYMAIEDIWGSSTSDLYVVGGTTVGDDLSGKMSHYDGTDWSEVTIDGDWPLFLEGVWGTSATDVFTVSSGVDGRGAIFHYDGTAWGEQHHIVNSGYVDIQGSSAEDVVAVGKASVLARYEGDEWEDVFKSDWYFDLSGVWGFSASDVFLVGEDEAERKGVILHYDGSDFELQLGIDHVSFGEVWGPSNTDVFASGYDEDRQRGVVYHYDGDHWTEQYVTEQSDGLVGLWGASGTDVFVVGASISQSVTEESVARIYHYDGTAWSLQFTNEEPNSFFNNVWGTSGSNVFAVGGIDAREGGGFEGRIFHYDGSIWTEQLRAADLTFVDIWGSSGSDVFVSGHDNFNGLGSVFHFDGTQWQPQYETPPESGEIFLGSVWGSSGADVYTMGFARQTNALLHYDGQGWSFVPGGVFSPAPAGIWGASVNDVFVVGSQGAVLHYDGNSLVEPAPEQQSGVTLDDLHTSSVSLSSAELAERYGTPSDFAPSDDVLSVSASISPAGLVGTFRFRVTGVSESVSRLILYKLPNAGEPLRFEYAAGVNSFDDGLWWITDEDGTYLDTDAVLEADRAYFVNFAIQDNGPGGYDLDEDSGRIEDPFVLGTLSGGGGGDDDDDDDDFFGCTLGSGAGLDPLLVLLALLSIVYLYGSRRRSAR